MFFFLFRHAAKQKLEDRLAAAAREKLAQASKEWKEKQLQAERKRKAALFLQTLRSPDVELKRPDESFASVEVQYVYVSCSKPAQPQSGAFVIVERTKNLRPLPFRGFVSFSYLCLLLWEK